MKFARQAFSAFDKDGSGSLSKAQMNLANGNLEVAGISAYSFDEQLHTFGEPPPHTLRAPLSLGRRRR